MENLSSELSAEESQLTFQIIQQVRDVVELNESGENTLNLIREIAIENQVRPELLISHI